MSAFIIILLLFAAALIGAVLLAVFQKKHRKLWLLSCAALIPAALIALSAVHITFAALPVSNVEQSYSVEAVSQKGYLDMAFALIAQGETMGAERVLNEYAAEYPISDNYLLARARMEAVRKNEVEMALDGVDPRPALCRMGPEHGYDAGWDRLRRRSCVRPWRRSR